MLIKPKTIPTRAGIYIFWRGKTPLYVGKAADLRKRASSYFKKNAGWKVEQLRREATKLEFRQTASEIEALIKEAEFIKTRRPKFNILMRDDKSYLYIGLTREKFPRFFFSHEPRLERIASNGRRIESGRQLSPIRHPLSAVYIGPFVEISLVKEALRHLRSIFPYCTCKKSHRGICVNSQIGRCPGYCCIREQKPTETKRDEYVKNIRAVLSFLSGKRNTLAGKLKKEMKKASKEERYEEAARLRDQIYGLEALTRHRGIALQKRAETPYHQIERVLQDILGVKQPVKRIEGYDIANISGEESTGAMIVFYEGKPDKSQYRKFKIKTITGSNDTGSLREVISRRLRHSEWEYPHLILVDGGKSQLNAVRPLLNQKTFRAIRVVALSKPPRKLFTRARGGLGHREDMLYLPGRLLPISIKTLPPAVAYLLQRIRDESHRFARAYHHILRKKVFQK